MRWVEVRVQRMLRGQRGLLLVRLCWHRGDRWRRHHRLQRRQDLRVVALRRRRHRWLERWRVAQCCLVVVVWRRQGVRQARVLVMLVGLQSRRVWRLGWLCLVVVDRQWRRVRLVLRRLDVEVVVMLRFSRLLVKRRVRLWSVLEDRCLMWHRQQHRQRRRRVHLWMRQRRLRVRLLERVWCDLEVTSRRLVRRHRVLRKRQEGRMQRSLVLLRLLWRERTHDTEASTRV